jgi:hypothetical protein
MGDSYATASEAEADRAQQLALLAALNATERALRRDECGAWTILGDRGTTHTYGDGATWIIFVACRSDRHWGFVRRRLEAFCTVVLDCDGEGTLRLHRLPTDAEATALRDAMGIPKRRDISDETRERLKAFHFEKKTRSEASLASPAASLASSLPELPPEKTPILDAETAK